MLHPAWWAANLELDQQGPGSEASTLRALEALGPLPPHARIADLGCGPGRHSVTLAEATDATVIGADMLPPFLARMRDRAAEAGVADRVHAVQCNIARPPLPHGGFDLVWSEGAIYSIGFEAGLGTWRPLLRAGGRAAVSEVSWIGEPPAETRDFWSTHYSEMTDVAGNRARAERAGYEVLETFPLPRADWDAYYDPIEERAAALRSQYAGDEAALEALDYHVREMGILERSEGSYSYVFYLLRTA